MIALTTLTLAASAGEKKPLHSGEFRNTAQTTEKGEFVYHPLFTRSHIGVADNVDLKFPTIGIVAGPDLAAEIGLVDNDNIALSVEPRVFSNWGFNSGGARGTGRFTAFVGANSRFNISAGIGAALVPVLDDDGDTTGTSIAFAVPLNVGYDVGIDDTKAIRFVANTDVGLIAAVGSPVAIVGANYNTRVSNKFTISAGLAAFVGPNPLDPVADVFGLGALPLVLPLPTFEMWWKF